jgi:hypothetical protein
MATVIFLALLIGFPIICGFLALRPSKQCPREGRGYSCHVYRNGYCSACGRRDVKLTRKRG